MKYLKNILVFICLISFISPSFANLAVEDMDLNAAPAIKKEDGGVTQVQIIERVEDTEATIQQEIERIEEEKLVITKVGNTEQKTESIISVAMSATETPATGAATWVVILGTLIINSFYYMNRRKKIVA